MSLLSSPEDFDPRILINEPLIFLHWFSDPNFEIFRQPRKVIPLSTHLQRSNHKVHLPLSNEQILSIKTHYHLEWQLLTIACLAIISAYFMLNPLLLFYIRFECLKNLDSQYASLLFLIFYGSCIVSIIFWMFISRLSIWHSAFNSVRTYINANNETQNFQNRQINNENKNELINNDSEDDDDSFDNDINEENDIKQKHEQTKINEIPLKNDKTYSNNSVNIATHRVTGFIVSMRWCLFGYALSLGVFSVANSYAQLIIASTLSGAFFPALLVSSSNVIVYSMRRLPSVSSNIKAIYIVIVLGWIIVPLFTAIIGELISYRWPFVIFAILILLFLSFTMFCHPGKKTISMIAEKEVELIMTNNSNNINTNNNNNNNENENISDGSSIGMGNSSISGNITTGAAYDDTIPLRSANNNNNNMDTFDNDDDSSVISDASSVFRLPNDIEHPLDTKLEMDEKDDGRAIRGGGKNENKINSLERQKIRYINELQRAGIDLTLNENNNEENNKCGCFENRILKNSCEYNFRLMSSSMGIFQITTFLLLIQCFCIDMCIASYLTWYPTVMFDSFKQSFIKSGIQMSITGIIVIFFATWVVRRNTTQFFLYSVNAFGSFFITLLCVCMIEFGDIMFYWFIFPLIVASIVLIGLISRIMLSRITPNGCLSFINGSQQIFHLAAFGIGPLILGIVNGYDRDTSDFYFFSLLYSLLSVHICCTIGLYIVQLTFTAIKVWGLSTYQNRP